jgi:hypothetical protein
MNECVFTNLADWRRDCQRLSTEVRSPGALVQPRARDGKIIAVGGALRRSCRPRLAVVRESGKYGVNVLGHAQSASRSLFARKGGAEKFDGVNWAPEHDLPRLAGAPGRLACDVAALVDGGDHMVVSGNVVVAETRAGPPLAYHRRTFGTHSAGAEQMSPRISSASGLDGRHGLADGSVSGEAAVDRNLRPGDER